MRYADLVYQHIKDNKSDTKRCETLDRRATQAGFTKTSDYLDNIQGRQDTRSFEGKNGRICWINSRERIYGWNNAEQPSQSTAIPKKTEKLVEREFKNHKENEAGKLVIDKSQIQERTGGIPEHERQVPLDKQKEIENYKKEGKTMENQGDKKQNQQEEQKAGEQEEQPKKANLQDLRIQAEVNLKKEGKEYKVAQEKQTSQEQMQQKDKSQSR